MDTKTEDDIRIVAHLKFILSTAEQELIAVERRRCELNEVIHKMKKLRSEMIKKGRA